jgi:large subunit ribosomal protein L40e
MPFPEAQKRLLDKKVCMRCYCRNPPHAKTCRKCHYTGLRVKSKERKAKA